MNDPTVQAIAKVHNKTSAQVALRWVLQQDIVVVTESDNMAHELQDLELFGWSLSEKEMALLAALK